MTTRSECTASGIIVKGFKGTDKDMKCRGFKFKLGVWHEHEGELSMCSSGFHFCPQKAGVYQFYGSTTDRIFEVDAEFVVVDNEPGCMGKYVCKRIRLVREVTCGSDRNTGNRNTGDGNTGNGNTGDRNTGDGNTGYLNTGYGNTGDRNTGDGNTGYRNTGYGNTGDGNTGDRNTGDRNTGDRNTGYRNTGDRNTGDGNTGDGNTGDGNCGNRNSGHFNIGTPYPSFFGREYRGKRRISTMPISILAEKLSLDEAFDPTPFLTIPFATKAKILALHSSHIAYRKKVRGGK